MNYYSTEPGKYPDKKPENSENEFFGDGWSIKIVEGKHLLSYISGSLQGQLKEIEIKSEDAEQARAGKLTLDEMLINYGVS